MSRQYVPKGYWQDWRNIEIEVQKTIETLKHFPTQKEMYSLGKSSLARAIAKYHGGMLEVREKMGHRSRPEMPRDFWKDWNNVENELHLYIEREGKFPTATRLSKENSSLLRAISQYHEGIAKVRHKMGQKSNRREQGYWQNPANVENTLREVFSSLGHFPTKSDLRGLGYGGLIRALERDYGGLVEARNLIMGSEISLLEQYAGGENE